MAKEKRYRVTLQVTSEIDVDVTASNKKDAEKKGKEIAKSGQHISPPIQTIKHKVLSVEEIPNDSDLEERNS